MSLAKAHTLLHSMTVAEAKGALVESMVWHNVRISHHVANELKDFEVALLAISTVS